MLLKRVESKSQEVAIFLARNPSRTPALPATCDAAPGFEVSRVFGFRHPKSLDSTRVCRSRFLDARRGEAARPLSKREPKRQRSRRCCAGAAPWSPRARTWTASPCARGRARAAARVAHASPPIPLVLRPRVEETSPRLTAKHIGGDGALVAGVFDGHGVCFCRMILLVSTREARWSCTRPSQAAPSVSQEGMAALEAVRFSAPAKVS